MVTTGKITREDRTRAWNELQKAATEKQKRPFYRAVNKYGLMYAGTVAGSSYPKPHFRMIYDYPHPNELWMISVLTVERQ